MAENNASATTWAYLPWQKTTPPPQPGPTYKVAFFGHHNTSKPWVVTGRACRREMRASARAAMQNVLVALAHVALADGARPILPEPHVDAGGVELVVAGKRPDLLTALEIL
eukprot:1195874-Prorocentrum_minimum.AAC.3